MNPLRHRSVLGFARRLALVTLVPAAAVAGELQPGPTARLDDVVVTAQPDVTTIHLKTSGHPKYQAEYLESPPRVVVDLVDTLFAWRPARLDGVVPPLRQVRGSQFRKGLARIVVELTRDTGYAVSDDGDGVVVVLTRTREARASAALAVETSTPTTAPGASLEPGPASVVAQAPPPPPARPGSPPPPPPPGTPGRLISLDFKDADVVNLLRILAAESGKNIVISDDVKGKMSITLKNVPWEQALDTILEARGLVKVERGNVVRIVSADQLAREREATAKMEESRIKSAEAKAKAEAEVRQKAAEAAVKEQEAQQRRLALEQQLEEIRARGPIREETVRLAYADPEDVARTLIGLLGITPGQQLPVVPPPSALPPGMTAIPTIGSTPIQERTPVVPQLVAPDIAAKGITIQPHKPTNSIFIRHYEKDVERIKKLIRETLDVQLPLIKIEGRITELNRTSAIDVGVQWGGSGAQQSGRNILVGSGNLSPTGGVETGSRPLGGLGILPFPPFVNPFASLGSLLPVSALSGLTTGGNVVNLPATNPVGGISFGIIGTRFNVNLAITALESEKKARTLHRPEIVTTDNNRAVITVGTEIPYLTGSANTGFSVAFKDAAVKLEVTPTVIREPDATKIKMKINVEDNSQGDLVPSGQPGGGFIPTITKRTAQTEVVVREGETLVIGGVAQRTESETITKVPMFGDIPLFGWLFKRRQRSVDPDTELAVFITPTVLRDGPRTSSTMPPAR